MAARVFAVALTLPAVAVGGLQALVVPLLMDLCMDSCDGSYWELHPEKAAAMTGFVVAVFTSACVFAVLVAMGRPRWATRAFAVHLILALLILGLWVDGSPNSADQLLGLGVGVELLALFALVICHNEHRQVGLPPAPPS